MSKKKKQAAEFRFYELPQDEPVLALMGSEMQDTMEDKEMRQRG